MVFHEIIRCLDILNLDNLIELDYNIIMNGSNIPLPQKNPASKKFSIRVVIFWIEKIIGRIYCLSGFHAMVLQSGLPGTPKYWCRRCGKLSKELW